MTSASVVGRDAYLAKCVLSILLGIGSLTLGLYHLAGGQTFAFQFLCQLDHGLFPFQADNKLSQAFYYHQ